MAKEQFERRWKIDVNVCDCVISHRPNWGIESGWEIILNGTIFDWGVYMLST